MERKDGTRKRRTRGDEKSGWAPRKIRKKSMGKDVSVFKSSIGLMLGEGSLLGLSLGRKEKNKDNLLKKIGSIKPHPPSPVKNTVR